MKHSRFSSLLSIACVFLALVPLKATTYYVSSAGNDSNPGSSGSPWLTLSHAVGSIACGDTINIVANGSYVAGDANLPYFASCSSTTTIQSSALASFQPIGYRTNPAVDSANYGKLTMSFQGIWAMVEDHGNGACGIAAVSSNTFTTGFCNSQWSGQSIANGTQVMFQVDSQGNNAVTNISTNLTILQKYYVVNCSSCNFAAGTFQVSATSGGSPISTVCTGSTPTPDANGCIVQALNVIAPLQVDTAADTITSTDAFVVMGNGTPVYLAAAGTQLDTLTSPASSLPAPFQLDTLYYLRDCSGRTCKLAATLGGVAIDITTLGVGPFQLSDARAPHDWAFRGLELMQGSGHFIPLGMYAFGLGNEASALGVISHVEVDRNWIHEDPSQEASPSGPQRGIADNAAYGNYHDNYIAGMTNGEAQAISGWGSPGPTTITNNLAEGAGEDFLWGGAPNRSGLSNANKTITHNVLYKPAAWRTDSGTGAPSGACWYDTLDPNHTGGQWFTDTMTAQVYRCNSSGMWATTGSTPPSPYFIKTKMEWKSLRALTFTGNLLINNWGAAQSGQAFNMGQQQGSGPGMANDTIVLQNNKATHVLMFGNAFAESCFMTTAVPCITALLPHNFNIKNNVIVEEQVACGVPSAGLSVAESGCGWHMFGMQHAGYAPTDFTWDHNTLITIPDGISTTYPWDAAATFWEPTSPQQFNNYSIKNSIMGYDFQGDGGTCGTVFSVNFINSTVDRIANPNAVCMSYTGVGASNTFTNWSPQANNAAMQFVDLANGDLRLLSTSPYSASNGSATLLSSDGTDLGADVEWLNAKTSGALEGLPTWSDREHFLLTAGSTTAAAVYDRPGTTACSLTLYNAPARITGNENADTNTSGNKLDTRAGNTVVMGHVTFNLGTVAALTPSTQYWYSLSCVAADMSTWLLAGDNFTTLAGTGGSGTSGTTKVSGGSVVR